MRSSSRRAALALCAALLLVTAGCSGGTNPTSTATATTPSASGTTTTTSTATTTATTATTGTWSPNASVGQYPPGVAANGTLTNVSALLDAHFDATANHPVAFTHRWTNPEESVVRRYVRGANPTPYYSAFNRTTDGERTTEEFYGTGSHGYSRVGLPDRTVYRVFQNTTSGVSAWTQDGVFGPRNSLLLALLRGNYSVNGTVERGGRTLVQLTADGVSTWGNESLTAYEGRALVTPEGVVYDVDASFEDTENNHVEESITLDTDVDWSGEPSWTANAPQLSLSIVEGGHALELRNTGGAALPANASFHVAGANETVWGSPFFGDASGTVTTDERLEPGDAVYVSANADGDSSSFALHDEPTRGEYSFGAAGVRGAHGNVIYRLATGIKTSQSG